MDKATLATLLGIDESSITDEQFESFKKQHESELDKARKQASDTSAKNTRAKAEKEAKALLEQQAAEKAQELLQGLLKTEDEKLEDARKEIEAQRAQLLKDQKSTAVSAKLKAAGYDGDDLTALTDLFTVKETIADCETSVDNFLENVNKTITAKVDEFKAELTNGGTPPNSSGGNGTLIVLDEGKILSEVYKHTADDGFNNDRFSNMELDARAVMLLQSNQEQMSSVT